MINGLRFVINIYNILKTVKLPNDVNLFMTVNVIVSVLA